MTTPATDTASAGGSAPAGAPDIVVQASGVFFAWVDAQWVLDGVDLIV